VAEFRHGARGELESVAVTVLKWFLLSDSIGLKDRRAMRSRPAISTRRMIGLTDGHPSFVRQTPSPRPSR